MKMKRILAIIGIIILVALYGLTLVFALCDFDNWFNLLSASVVATVLIPIIIWLYIRMSEIRHNKKEEDRINR